MGEEADMIEDTLLEREESDWGGTFTYAGGDYPCSIGPLRSQAALVSGGFGLQKSRVIVLRKSALPDGTVFHAGQFATVTDKSDNEYELKIAPEGINDGIYFWELTMNDRTQSSNPK